MDIRLQIYCMFVVLVSFTVFMCGFFPPKIIITSFATQEDMPTVIENISANASNLYVGYVSKLIFLVIDALRVDFINNVDGASNMPYMYSLIQRGEACLFTAKVDPPTVTMPRIKALMTGTVPNFVDVIYNLGSNVILEDNLIFQAEKSGKNIIFYGDDTWLKLFPNSFKRKEGTQSFFVSDFTEVDNNVTEHLQHELHAKDWQVMILHYLGLDHIGHLEGPRSSHVKPKLKEMDSIIKDIHKKMKEWEGSTHPVMVVCGDHGMKDSGGHGGATVAETTVPLMILGVRDCGNYSNEAVSQIDLVPTLSLFLGLPIPKSNIGKLINSLLKEMPIEKKLYALHYNARQMFTLYESVASYTSKDGYWVYKEAVGLYGRWLKTGQALESVAQEAFNMYTSALAAMSSDLSKAIVTYDVCALLLAIILMCTLLCCSAVLQAGALLLGKPPQSPRLQLGPLLPPAAGLACLLLLLVTAGCSAGRLEGLVCTSALSSAAVCSLLATNAVLCCHTVSAASLRQSDSIVQSVSKGKVAQLLRAWEADWGSGPWLQLLAAGSALHVVSLMTSSFIEEEHQAWYFLWLSFLLAAGCWSLPPRRRAGGLGPAHWCALALAHRALRKLNQTGDKWASLPDIGDWLAQPEHAAYLAATFLFGLAAVVAACGAVTGKAHSRNLSDRLLDIVLYSVAAAAICCYRCGVRGVTLPLPYPETRGVWEARVLWSALATLGMRRLLASPAVPWPRRLSAAALELWLLLAAALHKPHNVLLPAAQMWAASCLRALYRSSARQLSDTHWLALSHTWLGAVFFFYQGNSNSLATVDVAAGYVGQDSYQPAAVGAQLVANTYSAPVLACLQLLATLVDSAPPSDAPRWLQQHGEAAAHSLLWSRVAVLALYLPLMFLQRYHLFVWTVFSPKLLYEAVHTLVIFAFIIFTYVAFALAFQVAHKQKRVE